MAAKAVARDCARTKIPNEPSELLHSLNDIEDALTSRSG